MYGHHLPALGLRCYLRCLHAYPSRRTEQQTEHLPRPGGLCLMDRGGARRAPLAPGDALPPHLLVTIRDTTRLPKQVSERWEAARERFQAGPAEARLLRRSRVRSDLPRRQ